MRSLIVRLRSVFDLIVFDSPPVLGASDASILSAQADATIIVAAAGQTQVEEIDAAVNELRGMGARVFGTVLNRCDPSRGGAKYPGTYPYRQASRRRLFF
jgi:tyrosine-protein kinase Etk/Wzc